MSVEQLGHLCRVTKEVFAQKFSENAPLVMLNILPDTKYAKGLSSIKDSFVGQKHERMQRAFYDQFLRNFHLMLNRYAEKGQEVPLIGVAFYSLEDEPERPGSEFHSIMAPIERLINKYLESKWGILKEDGTPKGKDVSKSERGTIHDRDENLTDRIRYLTQERFSKRIKTVEKQKEEISAEK